ncbi:MAG: ACT domain-containing protein [Oscillospiraceae bacterium]
MRAVLTVVGKDTVGILAKVSTECAKFNVNINEVSQTILQDMFCMIMLCDISKINCDFGEFSDAVTTIGKELAMSVNVMHEDIFNSMHRI